MTSVSFSIDVPEGINPAYIEKKVNIAIESVKREAASAVKDLRVLEDDDAMTKLIEDGYQHESRCVVRASCYGKRYDEYNLYGNLLGYSHCRDDRRPVYMLGSLRMLIAKYAHSNSPHCANGWCREVLERYLRRVKYTCFEMAPRDDVVRRAYLNLCRKYYTTYHFEYYEFMVRDDRRGREGECTAWVNGKRRYLTHHQFNFLRTMYAIVQKTGNLEERIARFRDFRRLAA